MKVGDTIWRFDENHRVFAPCKAGQSHGPPIYREHWVPYAITSETRRSWVIGNPPNYGWKCPKSGPHPGFAFNEKEVDDSAWIHDHRYFIERSVGRVTNADILRQIAALIGWAPEG